MSMAVRRRGRRPDHANAGRPEHVLHRVGPFRIPIADQDAAVAEDIICRADETAEGLHDEGTTWMRCRAEDANAAGMQFEDKSV